MLIDKLLLRICNGLGCMGGCGCICMTVCVCGVDDIGGENIRHVVGV